ncbi:MAG: hypothetical protein QNK24_11020, partial [Desulfuromusa sp.]|nr:hypothetical protein [Desulfuromusa sp.]
MAAVFFLFGGSAFALHDGGVAHCDACHSMHNSADNPRTGDVNAPSLMKGSDASSTCLNCHSGDGTGYHNSLTTVGNGVSQGGDFFWVLSGSTYDSPRWGGDTMGAFNDPDNTGHNVIAADFGLVVDGTNVTAPGGIMPSNTLFCTSCHDPHGQVDGGTGAGAAAISGSGSYGDPEPTDGSILGNFRLLGDAGYKLITADAPIATSLNAGYSESGGYGNATDYGSGMTDWCLSCHPSYRGGRDMHNVNGHVKGAYNSYRATGDYTNTVATAYDAMVPFERNVARTELDPTSTVGSAGPSRIACISCHRAHVSAFNNAIRWDSEHEFLAQSGILNELTTTILAGGAIPYFRDGAAFDPTVEYGPWQRSLCNKCHVKD